jgi:hypothetical protein
MVDGGEAVGGVAKAAGKVRVFISTTGSFVKGGVVLWVVDVEFGGGYSDYGAFVTKASVTAIGLWFLEDDLFSKKRLTIFLV